jgi:hypothetical protein
MGRSNLYLLLLGIASFATEPSGRASDSTVYISMDPKVSAPASDLPIDRDVAAYRASVGEDLSLLEPLPHNDLYGSEAIKLPPVLYPPEGSTLAFQGEASQAAGVFISRVSTEAEGKGELFRLILNMNVHTSLAANALLRKLGYTQPQAKHYRNLTLTFRTPDEKKSFLSSISLYTQYEEDRWVEDHLPGKLEVTLRDVSLEPGRIEVTPYYLGIISRDYVVNYRAARALILPLALTYQGTDSLNTFSWELGKPILGTVSLVHRFANAFSQSTDLHDARWILRKIAKLSREDWEEIVRESEFPPEIQELYLEKLISRRNRILQNFGLTQELPSQEKSLHFKTRVQNRYVENGKVKVEFLEGHAERLSFGDPLSPLRSRELVAYARMEVNSQAIQLATTRLNERVLSFGNPGEIIENNQRKKLEKAFDYFQKNPGKLYTEPVAFWGEPTINFPVVVNRSVVSGTFYGSNSKAQVVDTFGFGTQVGFIGGLNGVKALQNVIGSPSIGKQRLYVHAKPILSLESARKEPWKHLGVPTAIHGITAPLRTLQNETLSSINPKEDSKKWRTALIEFRKSFQEGEVFIVTDIDQAGLSVGYQQPILPVMKILIESGVLNPKFIPSASIQGNVQYSAQRRTMFLRETSDQITIYHQNLCPHTVALSAGLQFFLPLASLQNSAKNGPVDTQVFQVNISVPEEDGDLSQLKSTMIALSRGLQNSDLRSLKSLQAPWEVHHDIKTRTRTAQFLAWNRTHFKEAHQLEVTAPLLEEGETESEDERTRTAHFIRRTRVWGKNPYSLGGQILSSTVGVSGLFSNTLGDLDPANVFLGQSLKRSVRTEVETTPQSGADAFGMITEVRRGWFASRDTLLDWLKKIEQRFASLDLPFQIKWAPTFESTRQIQAYEIHASLNLYETGLKRFEEFLVTDSGLTPKALLIRLLDLQEPSSLRRRCRKILHKATILNDFEEMDRELRSYSSYNILNRCFEPWMFVPITASYRYRKSLRDGSDSTKRRVRRNQVLNLLLSEIEAHGSLGRLMRRLEPQDYFFQLRVTGFRTQDENGDVEYLSAAIGSPPANVRQGVIREFSQESRISEYELNATYFSGGL